VKAWLSREDVNFEERDFFKDEFSEEELRELLGDTPPTDIFSWRSPSARSLNLDRDDVSPDELIRLMAEQPRLIRRPLIYTGNRLFVGTDKEAMAETFPGYNL